LLDEAIGQEVRAWCNLRRWKRRCWRAKKKLATKTTSYKPYGEIWRRPPAAGRAQKQHDAAAPENRLVADEPEGRWNQASRPGLVGGRIIQHSVNLLLPEGFVDQPTEKEEELGAGVPLPVLQPARYCTCLRSCVSILG
jgi:hypothetical protein